MAPMGWLQRTAPLSHRRRSNKNQLLRDKGGEPKVVIVI